MIRRRALKPRAEQALTAVCGALISKWVAGSFQAPNKFIVPTPSYSSSFDISGDTATGYWECHHCDASTTP